MNASLSLTRSIESIAPFRHSPRTAPLFRRRFEGTVPDWLRGEVVRTCPAIFETKGWRAQHWFDGLGMIYAFRIGASTVDFRSRLLDSETARDALQRQGPTSAPSERRPRCPSCRRSSRRSRAPPTTPTSTS